MVARATRMSAFESAKKASRAWLLCPTSRMQVEAGVTLAVGYVRRVVATAARAPMMTGSQQPSATPAIAANSVGQKTIRPRPKKSRPRPWAR